LRRQTDAGSVALSTDQYFRHKVVTLTMYQIGIMHEHPLIAWAVAQALAEVPDMEVHVLRCGADVPGAVPDHFDVLVTDRSPNRFPLIAGVAARSSCVLLMSSAPEQVCPGVDGYLCERSSPLVLAAVVHAAASKSRRASAPATLTGGRPTLSSREQQVLRLIAHGLTHDQAARRLGVSRHTVDTYVKRVRAKLRLGNKAELVRAAMAYGW
jgi:two-component system, NarL family, invasion response regulator UvrY